MRHITRNQVLLRLAGLAVPGSLRGSFLHGRLQRPRRSANGSGAKIQVDATGPTPPK